MRYLEAWKDWDYDAMYAMLSPLAQDGVSREAFANRYQELRDTARLIGMDYQIVSALVISPQAAEVRYRVTLQSSVVGDIVRETRMDLKREGEEWRVAWTDSTILPELTNGNGFALETFTPTRANIYDRNGQAFAFEAMAGQPNVAALWIQPNLIGDEETEAEMLSALRRMFDLPTIDPILERYDPFRGTDYFTMIGTVPYSTYQNYGGVIDAVGGVLVRFYESRYYYGTGLTPFAGGSAPHAVGYVSQIQAAELDYYLALGYERDDFVGRIGIEEVFEDDLRGVPGGTLYLTGPNGEILQILASRDPQPPYAIYTTLDRDLQLVAQQAIENFAGAVVVLERDTGAVLAMASSPGFDPNLFDFQNPNGLYGGIQRLNENPFQPFINRATHGQYPPGSVFKIVTMAAALESGEYEPTTVYNCGHYFTELPGFEGEDWRVDKELPAPGKITLIQGLEYSCNPYFWHIGLDLYNKGLPTALPDMAKAFGLGQETGIEIGDDAGLVPDPEWKLAEIGEQWLSNDAVQTSIGQGYLLVSPLQVARYVAAVGNGGTLYRPQLILRVENAEGEVRFAFQPEAQGQLPVSPENLRAIQQAMVNVVRVSTATAYRKFLGLDTNVAGKTGTATTVAPDPHAWFVGYSFENLEDKPDIAVVVVLEYAGEGSDWAAPVFRRVVETYFKGRPLSLYPWESRIRVERTATPTPEPGEGDGEATPEP